MYSLNLRQCLLNLKILKLTKFKYNRVYDSPVLSKFNFKKSKINFYNFDNNLISFGYFSKDFRLDASSETLLIEGDPDLKYLQEISERYGSKEFLILTYTQMKVWLQIVPSIIF